MQRRARARKLAMPPSRTPLIFPELPPQPVVRRDDRCCPRDSRSTTAGADRRRSRQINADRDWQRVVRVTRGRRRPLASIAVSSSGDRRPGMRRGVAPPAWHLSPRLLPLSVPLTRGAHSHKSHLRDRTRFLTAPHAPRARHAPPTSSPRRVFPTSTLVLRAFYVCIACSQLQSRDSRLLRGSMWHRENYLTGWITRGE